MDMTIDQQVALDEALVPHASRLRIGKSNFRLRSDITSKESTLQLVYDVLRLTPFYKAFLVIADVLEIYMSELWATATVHHHSIRFKMDNKKRIVNLEYFREMLHICPRLPGQTFNKLPFEEKILAFFRFLRHGEEIRKLTDVNINKLHQPWRSFTAVINKCLSGKSTGYDSLRKTSYIKLNIRTPRKAMRCTIPGSQRKTKSSSNTTITPSSAAGTRLLTLAKGKQPAKSSKTKGLTMLSEVAMTEAEQMKLAMKRSLQQTHISQASGSGIDEGTDDDNDEVDERSDDQDDNDDDDQDIDNDGDDFVHPKLSIHEEEAKDEESFDPIVQTPETLMMNVMMMPVLTTPRVDVQASSTIAPLTLTAPTLLSPAIPTISQVPQAPIPPTTALSTLLQNLPNFGSLFGFDHRLKTLEANFSEFVQTNQFARAVSFIPGIVETYMDQWMNEAVKVVVQIQSDRLRDKAQAKNDEFLKNLDENIQKIIKKQVKEQVKVQVSKILPKIEKTVNEQLEAEVVTRSSNSSKTSYAVAADLSEMEIKKILIKKIESNKSIQRSDEQTNLYKDWGSKRQREGKEPESTSTPKEKATKTTGKSTQKSKSHHKTTSESAPAEEPMHITQDLEEPSHQEFETGATDDQPIVEPSQHPEWFQQQKKPPTLDRAWNKTLPATHRSIQPWISDLAKQADSHSSFNELIDTLVDFSSFLINRLKVETLTPELLAGPTYELMKGLCKSLVELEFFLEEVYKETTDQLDWNNPEGQQYPHNLLKPLPLIPNSRGRRVIPFDHFINNDLEYLRGGASSRNDGTLNDVRTTLYDRLKGIQMKYLPQAIWRKTDKERAATMIQAIDKQLKTRRIMRSLEKFVGGRLYEGDFRMLQRTMSILTDSHVTPTKHRRMIKPYSSHRFIANYFNVGHLKMERSDELLKLKNFKKDASKSSQVIKSRKSKDSNEVVKNETGLRDFNDSSKEGVKSKENEHVGLGDFDEFCEEIVDGSSGIEKDSDCVMDLDDDGKETESKDCEYEGGDAATRGIDVYRFSECIHDGHDLLNQQKITCVVTKRSRFRRKKKGKTHVECYMHQIEIHTPMKFLDRKMVKNGYKMAICGINKLYDGVNRSFSIMGVFPKCNFEGLLAAKQVIK
nr:hypothetical protein [Tanacetum cinerariifolium]